jgi:hypothetical protein
MEEMNIKIGAIFFGVGLATSSLFSMLVYHQFGIYEITFLIGIIIAGIAYAKLPDNQKLRINTTQVNKNIQSLNDILFGKEKTESTINLGQENYWQISIRDHCRDIRGEWDGCYCTYGGKRGYCNFKGCPRRNK